ncbi:MAG: hypothetical protein K2I75_07405 [Clostridiales bacterium]|nr:hypothetical protein [Clostridiales bacterium]
MKKLGLIKRIGLTATTLFVCLAMLITCFTFVAPRAAKADEDELTPPTTVGKVDVAKGVKVKDSYNYGDDIIVPADATVTAPNGDEVAVTDGKVAATQLGVYKISYTTEQGISYDFNVSVSLKEDYFLFIKYNGADIPTYVEKGTQFTLPEAYVKYYDENNILREYPDSDYTIEIEDSWNNSYNGENKTFKAENDGKVFITYTAKLGKEGGTKRLTKTFTVNVQSKVNKSGNPSLAVSGMTQTASVNRPVTLPVAKVTDKSDDNVKVVIEVLDPDNQVVNNVKVNDDGYAYETVENDPVQFDNDKTMTFYPTKTGDYKVRYTAYNDFYDKDNPSAGGKSGTNEGTIKVADHVAPVFKNTDKYEYLIPEKWGMDVKNADGKTVDTQGKIKFLIPELVDNKCHMPANADDKDDLISLYFRITDSDNSKTVLSITNILSSGDDGKFTKNDVYDADATFNNEEKAFTFEFSKYNKKNSKGEKTSLAGTYTVLFRARDKDNNTSSKTYTVTLSETYEDKNVPNTAEVTAPDYLSAADETFTVPYPVYADKEDTRLLVDYRLYTAADKFISVKGGETASLTAKAGYLVINEGKSDEAELELGDNLYYYIGVTDKAGNFRSNAVAEDKSYIDVAVNPAEYTKIAAVTKIIPETAENAEIGFASNIKFVNAKEGSEETTPIRVGDTVNAGSFVITTTNMMRNYTGFEVAVYDPQGAHLDVTLETLSDVNEDDDAAYIYVQNVTFTATTATKAAEGEQPATAYTMTIRVFDVNGNNDVYGYKLTGVNPSQYGNNHTSAIANVDTKGNVNVKYKLKNSVIKHISEQGDFRVVRKITGGVFSLMGNEFTAKTQGSFKVWDGYINANKITDGGFNYGDVTQVDIPYSVQIVDDATPVIELQGTMPSYKAKYDAEKGDYSETNGLVKLPVAVAYTQYGMGEVTIVVKDPNGSTVDLDENNQFKADKDGAYKATYTATYQNAKEEVQTFTINVGDVFAPKFTVTGGTSTASAKKEGETFTFKNIELVEGESTDGVTVTKQIYDPSHELISGSTVDGSYTGYATKGNNGSEITLNKVGEYTIVYTAKDAVGNDYKITETLTVTSQGSSTPTTWTTLSTVLIIVAIVLLAGVIIYVVRFRKVKK